MKDWKIFIVHEGDTELCVEHESGMQFSLKREEAVEWISEFLMAATEAWPNENRSSS